MPIEHISDTARWVAVYRAMESERPDAHFSDPFARRLAGERGETIVQTLKQGRAMAWAMIVRTAVFDEIILRAVERDKIDMVINLAAGLDTRPWRLALPPTLQWVDVDLPGILDYKLEHMAGETPVCRYEAVRQDLTDQAGRRALFARLAAAAPRVLVVTEGLLIYLTDEQVASLAADLHAQPSFHWWLIDLASPRLLPYMQRSWGKVLAAGNAPFKFAPAAGTKFFEPHGWREIEFRSNAEEARRLGREMPRAWLWRLLGFFASKKKQKEWMRMAGIVLFERT